MYYPFLFLSLFLSFNIPLMSMFEWKKKEETHEKTIVELQYRNAPYIASNLLEVRGTPGNLDGEIVTFTPACGELFTAEGKRVSFIKGEGTITVHFPSGAILEKIIVTYAPLTLASGEIGAVEKVTLTTPGCLITEGGIPQDITSTMASKRRSTTTSETMSEITSETTSEMTSEMTSHSQSSEGQEKGMVEKNGGKKSISEKIISLMTRKKDHPLLLMLIVFLLGFLMSLTPCIYPMIPITLGIIGIDTKTTSYRERVWRTIAYVLGMACTFSLLGILAASGGMVFGALFNNPLFLLGIIALLIYLGGGMIGWYTPFALPTLTMRKQSKSIFTPFLFGIASGSITCPCVSPGLIALLALISEWKSYYWGSLLLFSFGVGLGVPFLALGFSTQLLALLPRSGAWMEYIKRIIGVAIIGVGIFFALPLISKIIGKKTEKKAVPMFSVAALASLKNDAKKTRKKILLDFTASWCTACKSIEKKLLQNPVVTTKAQNALYWVLVPLEGNDDAANELQKHYKVTGIPTFVLIDSEGRELGRWGSNIVEEIERIIL